jgi:aminoglycoside phosphotransferase (APT) family kinase protein
MDQVELRRLMARSGQLVEACAVPGRAPVLNHGDLNVANLLGPLPMLVDWEYAQLADPLHDYACLFTYYPQLQARRDWILGPAGLDSDAAWHALQARRALFALLNELWGRTQGALHGNAAGLVGVWPAE